jgi:hypothetical protein
VIASSSAGTVRRRRLAGHGSRLATLVVSVPTLRAAMLRYVPRRDACVLATRSLIDCCSQLGLRARAICVEALVANPQAWATASAARRANPGMSIEAFYEHLVAAGYQGEGWTVSIGSPDAPANEPWSWAGHLVAVVEERWMIDLTLDQANRPQHGIVLEATALEAGSFQDGGVLEAQIGSCGVLWLPRSADRSFERLPDWEAKTGLPDLFFRVVSGRSDHHIDLSS